MAGFWCRWSSFKDILDQLKVLVTSTGDSWTHSPDFFELLFAEWASITTTAVSATGPANERCLQALVGRLTLELHLLTLAQATEAQHLNNRLKHTEYTKYIISAEIQVDLSQEGGGGVNLKEMLWKHRALSGIWHNQLLNGRNGMNEWLWAWIISVLSFGLFCVIFWLCLWKT